MPATPTHAVGIVYRSVGTRIEYLLVRPRDGEDEWLFPKGHLEPGETPERAAVREVREEAGALVRVVAELPGELTFRAKGEEVRARCFLMQYLRDTVANESRAKGWFTFEHAMVNLTFESGRAMLRDAESIRAGRGTSG